MLFKGTNPKDPCSQIVHTLAPKYLYGDYFKGIYYLGTWTLRESLGTFPQMSEARAVCESVHNFGALGGTCVCFGALYEFTRVFDCLQDVCTMKVSSCMSLGFSVLGSWIRLKSGQLFVILTNQHSSR